MNSIRTPNNCADIDSDWFDNLVSCGISTSTVLTVAALNTCVASLTTTKSFALQAHLSANSGKGDASGNCVRTFSNRVFALKSSSTVETDCAFSNLQTSTCLILLRKAIEKANTCMNALVPNSAKDLVTGRTSLRCSVSDFVSFDNKWRPWRFLATGIPHPNGYDAAVSALSCGTCFINLGASMLTQDKPKFSQCPSNPFSTPCVSAAAVPLEAFAVCTGGSYPTTTLPTSKKPKPIKQTTKTTTPSNQR